MVTPTRDAARDAGLGRHVALGTLAFAVCFAAWGLRIVLERRGGEVLGDGSRERDGGVVTPRPPPLRGLTAIDGAMALIVILLIVQMWLLTAALEGLLAGHRAPALPAALVSAALFGACFGLYLFIERVDRASRRR